MNRIPRKLTLSRALLSLITVGGLLYTLQTYNGYEWKDDSLDIPEYASELAELQIPMDGDEIPPKSFVPLNEATELCQKHGMKPYPHRSRHRKVYDLFLVGTELDWTEIRLHELALNVDYFVILEADVTFTNHSKPMYVKKNWDHFARWESQIIYRALNDEAIRDNGLTWHREKYQRDALITQVFPSLLGEKAPNIGDVIIVSDVDEIPRPETIELLRNCDYPARTGIQSRFFLYSFQWHRADWDWFHPQATYWQGEKTILPESLRMEKTFYQIPDAAWHCTTCFGTLAEYINKIDSFSHQEFNKAEYKDPDTIVARIQNGTDMFDRGFPYEKIPQDKLDAPEYLLNNKSRFRYLLNRDGPNANFRDYLNIHDDDGFDRSEAQDFGAPKLPKVWHN